VRGEVRMTEPKVLLRLVTDNTKRIARSYSQAKRL